MKLNILQKLMLAWLSIGFVFWTIYFFTAEKIYNIFYFHFIILVCGSILYSKRKKIKEKLQEWKLSPFAKFIVLGYATVLFEEIFAALTNHLAEGFELSLYIERVGQFWALNFFAFTGFYFAWYFLLKKFRYSFSEIFFLSGLMGLFAERVVYQLVANPLYAFLMAPLMIMVYGLMITLPVWSIKREGEAKLRPLMKYALTFLVFFLFSILPILALQFLRTKYPWAFPPLEMIPM